MQDQSSEARKVRAESATAQRLLAIFYAYARAHSDAQIAYYTAEGESARETGIARLSDVDYARADVERSLSFFIAYGDDPAEYLSRSAGAMARAGYERAGSFLARVADHVRDLLAGAELVPESFSEAAALASIPSSEGLPPERPAQKSP